MFMCYRLSGLHCPSASPILYLQAPARAEFTRKEYRFMDDLTNQLKDELCDFQTYVQSNYQELSNSPVTSGDLAEFGKQIFYLFDAFREHIVNALDKD